MARAFQPRGARAALPSHTRLHGLSQSLSPLRLVKRGLGRAGTTLHTLSNASTRVIGPRASSVVGATGTATSVEDALFDSIVRIYCTHSPPDHTMPWQRLKQEYSTSSGFIIEGSRILTNAHAVEYGSLIQVKKRSSEKKYLAKVSDTTLHYTLHYIASLQP